MSIESEAARLFSESREVSQLRAENDTLRRNLFVETNQAVAAERDNIRLRAENAALVAKYHAALDEGLEQARLLGMSGEREAKHLGEIERLKHCAARLARIVGATEAEYRLAEDIEPALEGFRTVCRGEPRKSGWKS